MSLARRLGFVLLALLMTLLVSGFAVVVLHRHYLIAQLDARITELPLNPRLVLLVGNTSSGPPGNRDTIASEMFIGSIASDGALTAIQQPANDPELVPALEGVHALPSPATYPTVSGHASHVRVVTADVRGTTVVVAIPTTDVDAATVRLIAALTAAGGALAIVVGLAVWWVHRLGLAPIARITAAADAITDGGPLERVDEFPRGTEAARLGQAFNTMIDTTRDSHDRMRRFVADASHELRTPLTTLRGYSSPSAVDGSDTPPRVQDAMRRINEEATRMSRIVEALLDLDDLDSHGLAHQRPVNAASAVSPIIDDVRVIQPERPITVDIPMHLVVQADPDRVTQVVLSLVTNALRYTPSHSPMIIRGTARDAGKRIRIDVIDTGPGIDPEHLPFLFDRFYRTHRTRSPGHGGNGLGLAIVASIMHAHNGTYGVTSQLGQGTTFWVEFPAARSLA